MTWSLMNHMIADKVGALLDEQKDVYGPEVERFFSREKAAAIIHAAIWGYGVRADSTAGAYAAMNLFDALGLKGWTFDQQEADALERFRQERCSRRAANASKAEAIDPPPSWHPREVGPKGE
jgi:hypothetical protein